MKSHRAVVAAALASTLWGRSGGAAEVTHVEARPRTPTIVIEPSEHALGLGGLLFIDFTTSWRGGTRYIFRDAAEAVRWYHRAAAHGNIRALYALGIAYDTERGVPQGLRELLRWHLLAAAPASAQPLLLATPQP